MKKRIVGTGSTARLEITDDENDIAEKAEELSKFAKSRNPLLDWLDGLEAEASNELVRRGMPACEGLYRKVGKSWVLYNRGDPDRPVSLTGVIKSEGYAHDTGPGYAVEIIQTIRFLRSAIAKADPLSIAQLAIKLGSVFEKSKFKFLRKRQNTRRGQRPNITDRNIALAREFNKRTLTSHLSRTALMCLIGKEWKDRPLKKSAARDAIEDGLAKLSSGKRRKPD